jgi:peptidoglycan/LPS O-acetylase OafA/YrhL
MKLDQLTFTRYLAALSVVFFHYGNTVFPASITWLNPIVAMGSIAVSYFYVLSGFIMAIAYYETDKTQYQLRPWRYWLARFARIYPVYLVALIAMILAKWHSTGSDLFTVALSLSMLQAWIPGYPLSLNAPGWSISVEMFFYLCLPLLLPLAYRFSLTTLSIITFAIWLLTQVVHTGLLNSSYYQPFNSLHDFIYYNPIMHINTFILGLLAGIYLKQGGFIQFRKSKINNKALLITAFLTGLLLITRHHFIELTQIRIDYTNGLIAPLFLTIIILLALNKSWLSAVFSLPIFVLLGEASYSLYILQKPLHGIYEKIVPVELLAHETAYFYSFLFVLTLTAIASYRWFETPLRRLINTIGSSSVNTRQNN